MRTRRPQQLGLCGDGASAPSSSTEPSASKLARTIMRDLHSIKGEARMMNLMDINLVSHRTEDMVHFAHDGDFELLPRLSDRILAQVYKNRVSRMESQTKRIFRASAAGKFTSNAAKFVKF